MPLAASSFESSAASSSSGRPNGPMSERVDVNAVRAFRRLFAETDVAVFVDRALEYDQGTFSGSSSSSSVLNVAGLAATYGGGAATSSGSMEVQVFRLSFRYLIVTITDTVQLLR